MREFSEKIKILREKKGLTQEELASRLGLSRNQIKNYERGGEPDLEALCRIARFFDVSVDFLLFRETQKWRYNELNKLYKSLVEIFMQLDDDKQEKFCFLLILYAQFLQENNEKY